MKVLITGATGFLGGNLLQLLEKELNNDDIYILCSKPIEKYKCILHHDYTYSNKDLPQNIDTLLCIGGFVPNNSDDQKDGNKHAKAVLNLKYLLDNLPNVPSKILYCSSTEVYGRNNIESINEKTVISPYDLYSCQKVMCEGIIKD